MPVRSTTLGPGVLELGEVGSLMDFSCQVTAVTVSVEADRDDPTPTLCGDNLVGESTYNGTLEATIVQDLERDGVVAWSWENKGRTVPVRFIPSTVAGAEITGSVVVDPISIGGDVKVRNTSDISWGFAGEPSLSWDTAPAGGEV